MHAHEKSPSMSEKKNRVFGIDDIIMMIDNEFADGKVTSEEIIEDGTKVHSTGRKEKNEINIVIGYDPAYSFNGSGSQNR